MNILENPRHSSVDVSKLLSRILIHHLEKEYQVGNKDAYKVHKGQVLTFAELISWDVWPVMIKITCKLIFYNYILHTVYHGMGNFHTIYIYIYIDNFC